jgi:DNA ligase 1
LEKVRLLAGYLRGLRGDAVAVATTWFTGRPFRASQNRVLQLGWAVLRDALSSVAGFDDAQFHQVYLKHSDLGETAAEMLRDRGVASSLTIEQVNELFEKIHAARGPRAKTPLLAAALNVCTAIEAKFLVKIITGDLRIGLKEGLVEEAVAGAFGRTADAVRQANLLLGDIGETAKLAAEDRLGEAALVPFRPVKFMLASPEESSADVWARMHTGEAAAAPADSAVWLEDKYDGVRCQLHKVGARVALYSRELKEITVTFLELADAVRVLPNDFIMDGEIVAMRGEEVLPFAELQKRLGRREADLFMREEVPIQFVAFDLLWLNDESVMDCPLSARRAKLEHLAQRFRTGKDDLSSTFVTSESSAFIPKPTTQHPQPNTFPIRLARITPANSAEDIECAFAAARGRGNEGLMIKDPASRYTPGRRGLAWLKLKKALATLDCVVVGAEYGHGKRRNVLSDYTFAVRDDDTGELKTIGKAYSGLTDAEIAQLTKHFLRTAIRQHGRYFEVPPDTVLEIAFDRIQPSKRHSSGLAMRFPRIVRIRTDRSIAEIDTVSAARRLVEHAAEP